MSKVPSTVADKKRRTLDDLRNLPRSPALSKYRAALERVGKSPSKFPLLNYFSPAAWWQWFGTYGSDAFNFSCPFRTNTGPYRSIYPLRNHQGGQKVQVAIAGDWGTGTNEAEVVTESMAPKNARPHYTIHLGDIYYVGDRPSIDENCLGQRNPANQYMPVEWRHGQLGSFALNGNHEMYATGEPYFSTFLPSLGCIENGKAIGQFVSFFCLENDYWRVIGLDTGYHSRGLPFLSSLGRKLPLLLPSCRLPGKLIEWLKTVVKIQDDMHRGLVLLSHHQYYSAFEENYTRPAAQLSSLINRPVLWFWGHEHRMVGYHLQGPKNIQAHGRCVGHGGMPVERSEKSPNREMVLFADNRVYSRQDNFGWNGYVTLDFDDANLTVRYFDIASINGGENKLLIQENWSVNGQGEFTVQIEQQCLEKDFYGPTNWGG